MVANNPGCETGTSESSSNSRNLEVSRSREDFEQTLSSEQPARSNLHQALVPAPGPPASSISTLAPTIVPDKWGVQCGGRTLLTSL